MAENLRYARLELEDGRRVFVEVVGDEALVLTEAPWLRRTPTGERVSFLGGWARGEPHASKPKLLAPVVPSKILCVGRNYRAHAKELGNEVPVEPMIFYKPPSAILDPDGAITLPPTSISSRVEHEAELGVVIGRRGNVSVKSEPKFGTSLVNE